jgi:hypothetical protein
MSEAREGAKMQLHVICGKDGNISSIHTGTVTGPHAAISRAGVSPGPGQSPHTLEATDELKALSLSDIHRHFVVKVTKGEASLVRGSAKAR